MGLEWEELERRNRRAQAGSQRIFALGAVVTIEFIAWVHFFGEKPEPMPAAAVIESSVIDVPTIETPRIVEALVPLYQGPPRTTPGRERYVGVYECVVNGQRVVSDRPCAADAQTRTLVVEQPNPREVARQREELWQAQQQARGLSAPRSSANSGSSPGSVGASSNGSACAAVDRQIEVLNAWMRQGYSAPQGERYREQWHALKQRRYDLGCGR
jgi:hypothetical protein